MRKRLWSPDEDEKLHKYVSEHGFGNWSDVAKKTGLQRCGKSCRLRWINYLRPDLKRGKFTPQEKIMIVNLQKVFGNSWSKIAAHLPGRTDSDIKNFWHSHFRKKRSMNMNLTTVMGNENMQATTLDNDGNASNCNTNHGMHPMFLMERNVSSSLEDSMTHISQQNNNDLTQSNTSTDMLIEPSCSIPNAIASSLINSSPIEYNTHDQLYDIHMQSPVTSSTAILPFLEDESHALYPSHLHCHLTSINDNDAKESIQIPSQCYNSSSTFPPIHSQPHHIPNDTSYYYDSSSLHAILLPTKSQNPTKIYDDDDDSCLLETYFNLHNNDVLHIMSETSLDMNQEDEYMAPPPESLELVVWSCTKKGKPNSSHIK